MVRQPPQPRPKRHRPRAVHAKRLPEDEHVKGSIEVRCHNKSRVLACKYLLCLLMNQDPHCLLMLQMLELGARYENGKYVGRWREYDNTEDSEEETDDEDETAFWAYESRSTDTERLLNGEVGGLVLLSLYNKACGASVLAPCPSTAGHQTHSPSDSPSDPVLIRTDDR